MGRLKSLRAAASGEAARPRSRTEAKQVVAASQRSPGRCVDMGCVFGYYLIYNGTLNDERGSRLDAHAAQTGSACQGLISKGGHERTSPESFGVHGFDVEKSLI